MIKNYIPYGKQYITDDDIEAVTKVLRSDYLTQGPAIKQFEDDICAYTGAKFAVAVNSATSGLHIACIAMNIGEGSLVWTSPITFVATANSALFCGAEVDFIDVEPETFNISIDALKKKLESAARKPDLIIPVHMCGTSCDMESLRLLSKQYGFKIMEDAAHAIGASYNNKKVGACEYSECAVFSFHPVKIITTAEGGVITTNDEALYKKLLMLRTHGITRDSSLFANESHGAWYYEMQELSYNYRMTDMQAALGSSQMKKLDSLVSRRNEIAQKYIARFKNSGIGFQNVNNNTHSSYHLFPVQVNATEKKDIFDALHTAGIGANLHYMPVYLQPYYAKIGFKPGLCPNAENYYKQAISIPLYPQMSDEDVDFVADTLLSLTDKKQAKQGAA